MADRELLQTVPIFSELQEAEIDSLARLATRRRYPKDAVIFFENEAGDTLFESLPAFETESADPGVVQEVLESSNVNPVVEMAGLIQAMRTLETNLQAIRFQDATLDRAVNDLGRLTR